MIGFESMYEWVRDLPIVDWHNHLDMRMLAEDRPLGSLYEVWVKSDPYKHRAMRICGEPEWLITGDAPEAEKWSAWMRTLPKLVGNPLFAWAKMEMEWMGIEGISHAEAQRRGDRERWLGIENVSLADWTPSKILAKFGVEYISPCVGAGDSFLGRKEHKGMNSPVSPREIKIAPSLRMNAGEDISLETLERFHAAGCRIVDISVDDMSSLADNQTIKSTSATATADKHSNTQTISIAAFAAAHGWTMLLHLGALRETSVRLRRVAGPVGGFAGMRAPVDPAAVAAFLDALEATPNPFGHKEHKDHNEISAISAPPREIDTSLPRTILLSLNPEAHAQLAVLSGSFVGEGMPGKVQLGPAWWWCDHEEGIRDVLEKNAAYGVLSAFVGMTTDSRSLLSFVRHDYFRRILCKWVAEKVASGAFPDDEALLRPMLENVCYRNAEGLIA